MVCFIFPFGAGGAYFRNTVGVLNRKTLISFLNSFYNRFGRDNFQESLKLSSKAEHSKIDWSKFKYMVFDAPTLNAPYSDRYETLGTLPYLPSLPFGYIHPLNTFLPLPRIGS